MAIFIIVLFLIVALAFLYALVLRPWLKQKAWAKPFFDLIEPIELTLFKKSETILFARLQVLIGLLLTMLTQIGSIDLTPIMPLVPDKYEGYVRIAFNLLPMTISFLGAINEYLRNRVTKPIELVAVKETGPVSPEVAVALTRADQAKEQAVEAVKAAI